MFRRIQMEIIIGLLVVALGLWWAVLRKNKKTEVSAPYKVEAPATVVEAVPAGTEATMVASAPEAAKPAKAPAKSKAAARTAKPKAPAAAKAPAKAPAKPKAPRKPKISVAK